ncbi:MAG: serine/threonine-protein kinase, partial [Acidimicrobiales bacterium]
MRRDGLRGGKLSDGWVWLGGARAGGLNDGGSGGGGARGAGRWRRRGGAADPIAPFPPAYGQPALPGYANVSEIATGTFATVYRATELGTGRRVALKVLRVADTSRHMVEVFDKERGALALLSHHPNVTTLYRAFLTPEGRPVLVLELCRESLAHRVRQSGPLPPSEVTRVGVKIAGALETAHRGGLLHRDMKPQNILVSEFDEPLLADFGVAALQVAAQSTEGIFGFTTLHAPPEALEGQPLSPSADIYGLASSMYQLLLGRGPFAAYDGEAPASVILRILRDPAPRAPAAGVPVGLADLLESALAKDPRRRPQSAGGFAEALRAVEAAAGWPQTSYVIWGDEAHE